MTKTILMIAIAGALGSTAASAAPITVIADVAPSVRVSYADLNIASPSGLDSLRRRVRSAAGSLCLDNNIEPLSTHLVRQRCFRAARDDGYSQIDRALALRAGGAAIAVAALTISVK